MSRLSGGGGRYSVNRSMSCLDPLHELLSRHVDGVKREDMAHIARALFCPSLACKGIIKVHENNGTFVAMAEEGRVVYARCSDKSCVCTERDVTDGPVEVVQGTGARPWIKLTEDKMAELERTHKLPQKRKTMG
jgi:hypothetical protein